MSSKPLVSFDYAIKYLLKSKSDYDIIEGFISSILHTQKYAPVKIKALLDSESNKEESGLKRSIADLIVEDANGRKYIVEIDRSFSSVFLHKAAFNTSRLIVDTLEDSYDYSNIKKIYHINLLYEPPQAINGALYHGKTIFHEVDTAHSTKLHLEDLGEGKFDSINVFPEYFVISVPRFDDVVETDMDEWLYLLKHSKISDKAKSPHMQKVETRLNILTMSDADQRRYSEDRNKTLKQRDYIVSAKEKGKEEERVEIAKKMLVDKMPLEQIIKYSGLTKEQIDNL